MRQGGELEGDWEIKVYVYAGTEPAGRPEWEEQPSLAVLTLSAVEPNSSMQELLEEMHKLLASTLDFSKPKYLYVRMCKPVRGSNVKGSYSVLGHDAKGKYFWSWED